MRQVPHYLIIGDGRMATNFSHYLTLLNISYFQWARKKQTYDQLSALVNQATHILLLITDDAIVPFAQQLSSLSPHQYLIHFSGCLVAPKIYSAHPLMTFTMHCYDLKTYQATPFILDQNSPDFEILLPGLSNIHYRIPAELNPYYHALCVMSGNFTSILWKKFFYELENKFNIPQDIAFLYLEKISENLKGHLPHVLTGPLARHDIQTIRANLSALKNDEFHTIYRAFVKVFTNINLEQLDEH